MEDYELNLVNSVMRSRWMEETFQFQNEVASTKDKACQESLKFGVRIMVWCVLKSEKYGIFMFCLKKGQEHASVSLVLQVEYHPFQRPQELVEYCKKNHIVFGGYCPLAKGQALTHPVILRLAKQYGKTPAQICIRWSIQNGVVTIPKSTKESRIQENCQVLGFTLADADVLTLDSLHDGRHVSWDPTNVL
ncbi:unnamed protein product [Ranitomeya imitator]|uniref:NADP-dependent oxidoreductase domain-containing protein n=1 Tax=Ranitomeya imitator TaxID=111125 RepID=A0ABN9MEC5_9NEOB|nr:unnamed protein product [Ranitomeya imitator]